MSRGTAARRVTGTPGDRWTGKVTGGQRGKHRKRQRSEMKLGHLPDQGGIFEHKTEVENAGKVVRTTRRSDGCEEDITPPGLIRSSRTSANKHNATLLRRGQSKYSNCI